MLQFILFVFLYFIFTFVEFNRLDDFSYYKELQSSLEIYISTNIIINLFYFSIFAIIWIALLGFGSPIALLGGFMFGKWLGTIIVVIGLSVGATFLYMFGNYFLKDLIREKFLNKYGQNFWVIPLIFSIVEWHKILVVGDGDLFTGIMLGGFTYYFWGLGTGRIIDKDVKPFKANNDEEE